MDNLLDIYTKIKLRIGCEIIITYYRYGKKYTRTITLLDVCGFVYLFGSTTNGEFVNIEFFGTNTMIESIKVVGSNIPIYYNPYVSKEIFNGFSIDNERLFEINKIMVGDEYCEDSFCSKYVNRDYLIEKYIARDKNVRYDDLFFSDKQKEEFEIFFKMLTDELSEYAKKNGMNSDMKFICSGKTSLVYEIGDKIIKIGKPRRCNYIPYCEYLLQPIINRDFSFDGYPIHVEVTQKVLVLENKGKSLVYSKDKRFNEIVDELRKNLYSIGLYARDLHPGNVGILLDDNKICYDGISFDTSDDNVSSIESNNNLRILGKDRFVIIDLDCLWIEDIIKYTDYLKSIGYDKDMALDLIYDTKCMVRR